MSFFGELGGEDLNYRCGPGHPSDLDCLTTAFMTDRHLAWWVVQVSRIGFKGQRLQVLVFLLSPVGHLQLTYVRKGKSPRREESELVENPGCGMFIWFSFTRQLPI